MSHKKIHDEADTFRGIYWPGNTVPVDMETIIERHLGLDIIPEPIATLDAFLKGDRTGIVVNTRQYMDEMNRYTNRLRFSFAHEIGHYVLHESMYKKQFYENEDEYTDFITSFPEEEYKRFEFQANEFAGRLLVPRERLIEEIDVIYETLRDNKLLDELIRNPNDVLSRVSVRLSKPFGVSDNVIFIRAEREKLWPPQ